MHINITQYTGMFYLHSKGNYLFFHSLCSQIILQIYLIHSAGIRTLCQLSYEIPYLDPDCLLCSTLPQTINSIIMSGIAPKQNTFKFKIAQHKQKCIITFFWQEDVPSSLANGALAHPSTMVNPALLIHTCENQFNMPRVFNVLLLLCYKVSKWRWFTIDVPLSSLDLVLR